MEAALLEAVAQDHGYDLEAQAARFDAQQIIEREQAAGVKLGPFHRDWLIRNGCPERVQRVLRLARERPHLIGGRQDFQSGDSQEFAPANLASPIAGTTTETNLWNPGLWGLIPAMDMRAGKAYVVEYGGVCGTTSTPTQVWTARCGTNNSAPPTGTTLGASPTVTLGTFSAQPFYGRFVMGVRSVGVAAAGATVTGNGFSVLPAAAAATVTPHIVFGGAIPATIDHTIAQGLGVSMTWGTSNASNTLTCQWMLFQTIN